MRKQEFLDTLARQTKNARLVEYYDELISDRVQEGEREEDIIAGFDIKQIIRLAEIEASQNKNKVIEETTYKKVIERDYSPDDENNVNPYIPQGAGTSRGTNHNSIKSIVYLVCSLVSFGLLVVCLIMTGYQISEVFGYTEMYDRVEHGVYAAVSGAGVLVFLILGIVFLVKHSKYGKLARR